MQSSEGTAAAPNTRRPTLSVLWGKMATQVGLPSDMMRLGGRSGVVMNARDQFICQAVREAHYRATEVAAFLGRHPSNITRALRKKEKGS